PGPEHPRLPGIRPSRAAPSLIEAPGRLLGPDQQAIRRPLAALLHRLATGQPEGMLPLPLAEPTQQLAEEPLDPPPSPDRGGRRRAEPSVDDDLPTSDVADALPALIIALALGGQPDDQAALVGFRFAQDPRVQGHFTPVDHHHLRR